MFCCCDTSYADPKDAFQQRTSNGLGSSYPGARGMNKTGGNALQATPTTFQQPNQYGQNGYDQQLYTNNQYQSPQSQSNGNHIQVVVPPGITAGQMLQVSAPDGRIVHVNVPQGISAGSTFMVEIPPVSVDSVVSSSLAASSTVGVVEPHNNYSKLHVMQPPACVPTEPFATAYPVGSSPNETTIQPIPVSTTAFPSSAMTPPSSSLIKVQVPPGTPGGSTVHVQIPGENRTIAAQVPHGQTEFHVCYVPHDATSVPIMASTFQSSPVVAPVALSSPSIPPEKLLLVKVPPGTSPGTTLHVCIPDEPGRVLAATVPPGVSQFHVSYTPQVGRPASHSQGIPNGSFRNNNSNGYYNRNDQNNNNNGGGMGSMILPLLGGAAMGAGLMSVFDHTYNAGYDNSPQDAGDYGGDVGGGDYGGDDYGGGDYGGGGFGGGDY